MPLHLPDSTRTDTLPDGRRLAASASRNAAPLLDLLARLAPAQGRALELASGTGQHIASFAAAHPGLDWQPTEADPGRLPSIAAWVAHAALPNLRPPVLLDATTDWTGTMPRSALVITVNLLHLIPDAAATRVLAGMAGTLAPGGVAIIYGPFLRAGRTTSEGDAAFDAALRAQDPAIGYKDAGWAEATLAVHGLTVTTIAMPANNLALIARRS